jgi:hypothetical protein
VTDQQIAPLLSRSVEQATPEHSPISGVAETSDVDYSIPAVIPELDPLPRLDYHIRMVRKYRHEASELDAIYRAEMDRITDRYKNRLRIIQSKIDWHASPIESYHRAHDDTATLELTHGASRLRKAHHAKVFMPGETSDVVTEWARTAHPEILRGPNVTDVRRVVDIVTHDDGTLTVIDPATGEVVPGVKAEWPVASWSLDTEAGEPF